MPDPAELIAALSREGNLMFAPNLREAERLKTGLPQWAVQSENGEDTWFEPAAPQRPCARRTAAGHLVFYTALGHRFLMTDPEGHPLHEAEWAAGEDGAPRLLRVRMQLDSRQWVGIQPRAKRFTTHIDIKSQPGWKQMQLDDLRRGAAQAWQVPYSEVTYFYKDENFISTTEGEYDVYLDKDSLYVLIDGTFERKMFISHMFGVNWERLDLIPVVELFQSALAGSGGAVFEFIWGLYADQNREQPLSPLRYRGLPTYPSKEAFNIFKAFFEPGGIAQDKLLETFMNPDTSHEIEWVPRAHPPCRYFDADEQITLTVQEGFLYKVNVWNDPAGLPYINISRGAVGPCDRDLEITGGRIILRDGQDQRVIPLQARWRITPDATAPPVRTPAAFGWREFFIDGVPDVDPVKLLYTVPFYPEGEADIEESATQPLVIDQILQYMEETGDMEDRLERVESALIHTFDTVISGCIDCTTKRRYTVLYGDAEFAVKNAQLLWGYAASRGQLDHLSEVKFCREADHVEEAYQRKYDLIFKWIPFMYHTDRETSEQILRSLTEALNPGGLLFLAGPAPLQGLFEHYRLQVLKRDLVAEMPYFRQHLKMCPENTINPYLSVFFAERMPDA